jgi:hypothetical protein
LEGAFLRIALPLEFDKFPEVQIDIPASFAATLAIAGLRTFRFAGAGIPGDSVEVETLEVFITAQTLFRRTVWIFLTDHNSSPLLQFLVEERKGGLSESFAPSWRQERHEPENGDRDQDQP